MTRRRLPGDHRSDIDQTPTEKINSEVTPHARGQDLAKASLNPVTELRESHAEKVEKVFIFFEDLDAFGMVYHGRFAALIERATSAFFTRHGLTMDHEDARMAVKEISITFEHPITAVGPVDVALWVEYIHNSSAKFGFCVRTADITHAYGHRVVIKIDAETFRPAPWTDEVRQLITGSLLA